VEAVLAALPQVWRRSAKLALVGFALLFARAQTDAPTAAASFAVTAQTPSMLEVRFRGVSLRGARADAQQNQIALDFNQPIDIALFDQFQQALPDWVDMAYGGYDNAVIHARRPVQFLTRNEPDGFSIRLVPQQMTASNDMPVSNNPPPPLPLPSVPVPAASPFPPNACDHGCPPLDGAQPPADAPFALRGTDGMRGVVVRIGGDYRHAKQGNVYALRYAGTVPVGDGFKIVASARAAVGSSAAVRRLDGTITPLRKNMLSGSLGAGYDFDDGSEIRAEGLYSQAGFGGLLSGFQRTPVSKLGMSLAYNAPYLNNTEQIADRGSHDIGRIFGNVRFMPGFWGRAEGRYERFHVKGDSSLASTAGFTAGLRWFPEWFNFPFGFAYDVDADYVIDEHVYLDPALNPFVPMNIHTREVHALSVMAHVPFDETFGLDAFGGYAYDRYGKNGPFGGANVVIIPADGWKLSLGGLYSIVPNRQSSKGPVISASVKLIYDLSSSPFDPFSPGFLPDEI
jgi:hypothetical protein